MLSLSGHLCVCSVTCHPNNQPTVGSNHACHSRPYRSRELVYVYLCVCACVSTYVCKQAHLLLISLLQYLHGAASLAVGASQGGTAVLWEVRGRGHTATLRVHPGVHMVSDITPRDTPHRPHPQGQLLTALQHLGKGEKGWRREERKGWMRGVREREDSQMKK